MENNAGQNSVNPSQPTVPYFLACLVLVDHRPRDLSSMLSLVFFALLAGSLAQPTNKLIPMGNGFWNVRSDFYIDGLDIGTQMSIIKLRTGRFIILDTIQLTTDLKGQIDNLTNNGTLIDAVLATHPFHTVFFPAFYAAYPKPIAYYGTPRHLRVWPNLPWAGTTWDCAVRSKWLPDVRFRIPRGSEFVAPQPESSNHFSGIHVFHVPSKTIHVDDTIMFNEPFNGDMMFHPSIFTVGLYHIPQAPTAFGNFISDIIAQWDFENICAAHDGIKQGGAKDQLKHTLSLANLLLDALIVEYTISPNATDANLFKVMEAHENSAACRASN
jgi:hypothetical protein